MSENIQQFSLLTLTEGKTCNRCGPFKPFTRFSRILESGNLRGACLDCRRPSRERERELSRAKWQRHSERIKQERRIARANWTAEQKERERQRDREYAARCKEKVERYQTEWRNKNRQHLKEWSKRYRSLHKAEIRARNIRRRALKADAGGSYSAREWRELCARYDNRCVCCGERKPLTVDHVIPIARGGSNDISNLQPLCLACNIKKGARATDYR